MIDWLFAIMNIYIIIILYIIINTYLLYYMLINWLEIVKSTQWCYV